MTSLPPLDDQNDDDFDWEAAVREIDVACQLADTNNPSNFTPPPPPPPNQSTFFHKINFPCPSKNQSTLDRFLGRNQRPDNAEQQITSSVEIDVEAAKTWIYPVNIPLRDYQLAIAKTALFSNTLVALPTGLGKTLIAAVVMYNYFRWFPHGKIVFAAPSRPLVMQQIEACHNIVGIPQEWTIDMTGQVNPKAREGFWKTKRVFFVTPQVLDKDIQAGRCLVRHLVCLVIDEAHRASGNYSYCVAVRELMAVPVQLRILALTATPGSKQQAVQHIVDNLYISTLEYRDENDPDVSPYVHNRKIELIEVPMGKDAVDVNAKLMAVIHPYAAKLSAVGILPNRDYQTLSPHELLNSREKIGQVLPENHHRRREMEGYLGILITLCHIRKLLSGHGIRPAYEMLEEKLKQGSLARLSKNEDIRQVKLLMEKSLSHGAPSPKLSKMLEIMVDHFSTKDPQHSRVIVFSNFRGSVRDIMNALTSIKDLVKATEFIGQSSGKASKGQSQKVQQAVLQKFRAGEYNVIVATSIGEEGLDIMEVDLVICFDANISPLRMIQRMGRTGRKHDGRVVVLACEGSELKGYMRKQASGRSIRKHMHNGGLSSFNFHSSPRMIPHAIKPEVQFMKISIQQYISNRKKVNGNDATRTPVSKKQLSTADTALIEKYFQLTQKNIWRPSMIAFPRFQSFPSKVHSVMHSSRTEMLVDTMQQLQGLSFSSNKGTYYSEIELPFHKCAGNYAIENVDEDQEDKLICDYPPSIKPSEVEKTNSGDMFDKILIYDKAAPARAPQKLCGTSVFPPICEQSNCSTQQEMLQTEVIPETLNSEKYLSGKEDIVSEPVCSMENSSSSLANVDSNNFLDGELSPRLTSMIKSGIVPESPIDDGRGPKIQRPKGAEMKDCNSCNENVPVSPNINVTRTPLHEVGNRMMDGCTTSSPDSEEANSPLPNTTKSCTQDWLCSGEKSEELNSVRKLKRLRKIGDVEKIRNLKGQKENHDASLVSHIQTKQVKAGRNNLNHNKIQNARAFIEEEAEVSSEVEASEGEEDDQYNSSYDHSFIDDQTNPTAANTQGGSNGVDMMAIYRRSLLTQSPIGMESSSSAAFTPDCVTTINRTNESSSSAKTLNSAVQTPHTDPKNHSHMMDSSSLQKYLNGVPVIGPNTTEATVLSTENELQLENRKRKFSFGYSASIPAINLEQKFYLHTKAAGKEVFHRGATAKVVSNYCAFDDDDQFFAGLDLDAVEQEATLLLKNRSEISAAKLPEQNPESLDVGTPSFDLGI